MDIERAMETQRLRLLRVLAGLIAVVAFVSAAPFSSAVSRWFAESVFSILLRAEAAAQCLVIVQARLLAVRKGSDLNRASLPELRISRTLEIETPVSLKDLRKRLDALRALLSDLPRHGLRLLRSTEKRAFRAPRTHETAPSRAAPGGLTTLRIIGSRIERPPDKGNAQPSNLCTSPRFRAGGEDGCAEGGVVRFAVHGCAFAHALNTLLRRPPPARCFRVPIAGC